MIRDILHTVWSVVMHLWLLGVVAVILFGSLSLTTSSLSTAPSDLMASVPLALLVSAALFLLVWLIRSRRMVRVASAFSGVARTIR